jgi:hypothetical protein
MIVDADISVVDAPKYCRGQYKDQVVSYWLARNEPKTNKICHKIIRLLYIWGKRKNNQAKFNFDNPCTQLLVFKMIIWEKGNCFSLEEFSTYCCQYFN